MGQRYLFLSASLPPLLECFPPLPQISLKEGTLEVNATVRLMFNNGIRTTQPVTTLDLKLVSAHIIYNG